MTDEELKQLVAANAIGIAEIRKLVEANAMAIAELKVIDQNQAVRMDRMYDILSQDNDKLRQLQRREIDLWGNQISSDERIAAIEKRLEALENRF